MSFLDVLINKGILKDEQLKTVQKSIAASNGKNIEKILAENGVTEAEVVKAKEEYFNLPFKPLSVDTFSNKALKYAPENSALYYQFVPLGVVDGFLEIGILDPENLEALDAIQFISSKTKLPFKLFLISEAGFKLALNGYKGLRGEVSQALSALEVRLSEEEDKLSKAVSKVDVKQEVTIVEDAPVSKIVATILRYATEEDASDVHIEHVGDKVRVRFRVDGVLSVHLILPPNVHDAVVARIKILSKMRLDEKRKPQDGRFSVQINKTSIDFRVSTFPSYYGEKVVMRLLRSDKGVTRIADTGLSKVNLDIVMRGVKRLHGLILISGPTGSGKTTTLYSILHEIDCLSNNVLSLEDPVERTIEGVSQSQVRAEIGYTFASGLRTILRQDPDVIMVGEIRDKETAGLAIQAALTGHLVFSTIHTNDAVGVIPRLIEMGVDPYLIAPTLIFAMAQRLVRTLVPGTGKAVPIEGSVKMIIEKAFETLPPKFRDEIIIPENVYEAVPSSGSPTGMKGRVGVFEILEMDKDLEKIILTNPINTEIEKMARDKGMLSIREDGLIKAFNKIIPFEEANKL